MADLNLRKGDRRYYVEVSGVTVGWVLKDRDGWRFYATVRDALQGTLLASGEKTRRDALMEGLAELRIRHLGRVMILSHETWKDEAAYVSEADLKAIDEQLLDEKYPLASGK